VRPPESSKLAAGLAGVAAYESSSFGIHVSFRVFRPSAYRRYWFSDPAVPLTVVSAVRFSADGFARPSINVDRRILSSSSLPCRVFHCELWPARRGLPAPLMDFCSLQHSKVRKSTLLRGRQSPAVHRPQGLVTLSAICSFRARASLISCRRRSWDFTLRSVLLSIRRPRRRRPDIPACRFFRPCRRHLHVDPSRRTAAPRF